MNYFNTFVFVLFISFNLKSQYSWEHSIAEPLVQEAIHSLYNFDFDNKSIYLRLLKKDGFQILVIL